MSRGKYKESLEINLIPYIDILLVLVLILMLTSAMSYQAHDIQLPSTHGQQMDGENTSRHISLKQNGEVGIKWDDHEKMLGQLDQLEPSSFADIDVKEPYTLDADNGLTYQRVVDLLALLKQAGFERIALAMQSNG